VLRVHLTPDVLAGALFLLAGVAVYFLAGQYPIGDAARMGPGYFPRLLGGVLVLLGLAVIGVAWRRPARTTARGSLPAWLVVPVFWGLLASFGRVGQTGLDLALAALLVLCWPVSRPLFWVLASVGGFALLLEPLGLAISTLALMAGAHQADPEMGWMALLVLWFGLFALSVALFVWGLGTPIPLWPSFLVG
jgi:hypothetical protein